LTTNHAASPWADPAWIEEAEVWIRSHAAHSGYMVLGTLEKIHERPWSIVFQVPAAEGRLIFKASAKVLAHEAALTQSLADLFPNVIPTVLGAYPERGWLLMVDGGIPLREFIRADRDVGHWERLLPQYAELQKLVSQHLDQIRVFGIPDRSLAKLPALYQALLEDQELLLLGMAKGLTADHYDRLIELIPGVKLLCEQLQATPIPGSIHHGDLHDGNIFYSQKGYQFFDWGDASISHPFFSLRTVSVSLENSLGWAEDSPDFDPLRNIYLEAWGEFASLSALLESFNLARVLSPICSALSWHRVISSLVKSLRGPYEGAVPGLLQEFLTEFAQSGVQV
jgi:hypothetical protein